MVRTRKTKNDKLIELATKNAETIKHNVDILENLENKTQHSYLFIKSQILYSCLKETDYKSLSPISSFTQEMKRSSRTLSISPGSNYTMR